MTKMMYFFFQAGDGIRDLTVTGVQTCALPISCRGSAGCFLPPCTPLETLEADIDTESETDRSDSGVTLESLRSDLQVTLRFFRSEERRVGKECRSRWWPCY